MGSRSKQICKDVKVTSTLQRVQRPKKKLKKKEQPDSNMRGKIDFARKDFT